MNGTRAVFFDFDGTLIDSRLDLCATVNHTRRDLGLAERGEEVILAHVGLGAKYLLAHAIPECASRVEELWQIFKSHYGEHMLEKVQLYPGVFDTLSKLRDDGWLLGVNTAKPAFATHAILEHFKIAHFFGDAVIASGDCPEMKPSALPVEYCAARLGHELGSGDWMVGDNWTDVECAHNAKIKSVFCAFGFGKMASSSPSAIIETFPELLRVLQDN